MSARAIKGGEPLRISEVASRSDESSKADIERSRGLERSPEIFFNKKRTSASYQPNLSLDIEGAALTPDWLVRTVITCSDCLGDQILLTFLLTNF